MSCVLDMAEKLGILTRKGSWYSYKDQNIAQGRDKAVALLEEDKDFAKYVPQPPSRPLYLNNLLRACMVHKQTVYDRPLGALTQSACILKGKVVQLEAGCQGLEHCT